MIADVAAQTEHVTRDTVVPPNSLRRYVCIRAAGRPYCAAYRLAWS